MRPAFDILRPFRRRENRRRCDQQVDVIRRDSPANDRHVPRPAHLPDQVARTLRHPPVQYLVTILRAPDQVILQVVNRVRARPVFRHPSHCRRDSERALVEQILVADKKTPRKQRHTAHRIGERIQREIPECPVGERTVRSYVHERKVALGLVVQETFRSAEL